MLGFRLYISPKMHLPKTGTQTKRFKFIFTYELHVNIENLGLVKLTVGVRENAHFLQYCVTSLT